MVTPEDRQRVAVQRAAEIAKRRAEFIATGIRGDCIILACPASRLCVEPKPKRAKRAECLQAHRAVHPEPIAFRIQDFFEVATVGVDKLRCAGGRVVYREVGEVFERLSGAPMEF